MNDAAARPAVQLQNYDIIIQGQVKDFNTTFSVFRTLPKNAAGFWGGIIAPPEAAKKVEKGG